MNEPFSAVRVDKESALTQADIDAVKKANTGGIIESFLRLLRRSNPKEDWLRIISSINQKLSAERALFFAACVSQLGMIRPIPSNSRGFDRHVDLAIAMMQFHMVCACVAEYQYVDEHLLSDFDKSLFGMVCQHGDADQSEYCRQRYNADCGGRLQFTCFYRDVIEYITDSTSSDAEVLYLINGTLERFSMITRLAVTTSFADRVRTSHLMESIQNR